jgi:Ca2+-binding EF-hand superfamily protein
VSAAHIVIADLQAPNIEAIFRAFDTSGDGLISIAEMKAGLAQA